MQKKAIRFSSGTVNFYFDGGLAQLRTVADQKQTVLLTDEHLFEAHQKKFRNWNTIVLKAGEEYKVQSTVDSVIGQLIGLEADRRTTLVGIGGGVITDLTGYIASIYMRGIAFGFIPTSLLALVDASIGGKNGIDVGMYKNMVGVIRQPSFILHDLLLLKSLPENEWRNGFAEIIKHAAIKDAAMFRELEAGQLSRYQKNKTLAGALIRRNALLKTRVVQEDEFEQGNRKLLNFGHTLGHALENQYALSHGEAISIGMTYAARLSQKLKGFRETDRLVALLERYRLPTFAEFDKDKAIEVLKMDKKKQKDSISFILLEKIGRAVIQPIPIQELYDHL
jgi:3-dehydroquinate synthase